MSIGGLIYLVGKLLRKLTPHYFTSANGHWRSAKTETITEVGEGERRSGGRSGGSGRSRSEEVRGRSGKSDVNFICRTSPHMKVSFPLRKLIKIIIMEIIE